MRKFAENLTWRVHLALIVLLMPRLAAANQPAESPLQVIMAGREEAGRSMLTEEGARTLSASAANVIMYVSGAVGIAMAGAGIYYLWQHFHEGDASRRSALRGAGVILLGGLLTIPAIMAAIAPHAVLGSAAP